MKPSPGNLTLIANKSLNGLQNSLDPEFDAKRVHTEHIRKLGSIAAPIIKSNVLQFWETQQLQTMEFVVENT